MAKLTEYKDMNPRAKAVVEGIAAARGIDPAGINNVWKALARHPAVMEQFAAEMKEAFAPGKLDPLTKELVYLAVSIANQCDYCIASHGDDGAAEGHDGRDARGIHARGAGGDQKGNKIATAYRVPVDKAFEEE